ncbi:MAG: GxGYxYP domain-containing protein [Opitutales bacterium]
MKYHPFRPLIPLLLACAALAAPSRAATPDAALAGKWTLLPLKSAQIDLFDTLTLDLQLAGGNVAVDQIWGQGGYAYNDRMTLKTDGSVNAVPVTDRVWVPQPFMGVSMKLGSQQAVTANWSADGRQLVVERKYTVLASQGPQVLTSRETYTLGVGDDSLTLKVERPTRTSGPAEVYAFKRSGTKEAFMMKLENHWTVADDLDRNALLISLQGLANTDAPRLYFIYPEDWEFRTTQPVYDFYRQKLDYTFTELKTPAEALAKLKPYVKGYIVWDRAVRNSLDVAFTLAGLERGVVVSADQIPLAEKAGLKLLTDLRGQFTGMNDETLFRTAYARYGAQCSRDTIIWMGGVAGPVMKPAIADYGIAHRAFVTDLSCRQTTMGEYGLAKEILSKQKPFTMVLGWHSYAKDQEREFVSLTSSFALRVEGLNTFPNLSFTSKTPPSPGFKFVNHHNVVPGKVYQPAKKVYIACLQTDGLGLGAWTRPGRGEIPYAWEVTINWSWMAPTLLEYYYSTATKNDLFIGALTGPGYMYPKAIPRDLLPGVVKLADELSRKLDINVFETMDYSEGATVRGNTELPKYIVDAYYQGMRDMVGFANGYAPAYTFAARDGRPFVSFDYYLSETRPEAAAAADIEELAKINPVRPYFLLIHVREWSDISRVKAILDRLGPDFEVVPMDVFLKLAGQDPTFQERYYPSNEPVKP